MNMRIFLFSLLLFLSRLSAGQNGLYEVVSGSIHFTSDAPLELIEARSEKLRGLIDPEKKTFAFSIPMSSFEGFNSPLQREHFNENYVESRQYPKATFSGKIIEQIDFEQDGEYSVRTKGELNIHGVERERIIKSDLQVKDGRITIQSRFSVLLEDHEIAIPKIVYQKISEEIVVVLEVEMQRQTP